MTAPLTAGANPFQDRETGRRLIARIGEKLDRLGATERKPVRLMEICGGHTHTIFRHGLSGVLPAGLEFLHGPGCPVCVLPMGRIDDCVAIAEDPRVIFTTFGDAMRVPGSKKSLMQAKADGADIRMVYSPLDALELARRNPDREVVFFGLGFETTMPSTALTVLKAEREGIANFSLFCNHITIIPTIRAVLDTPGMMVDGFIGPGHVSMVIGLKPYRFIASQYDRPLVVTGFEPLDVLQSVWMLLDQIDRGVVEIQNQYARVVPEEGNPQANAAIDAVFETRPFFEWRGLGSIDESGVAIRERFARFDAERRFAVRSPAVAEPDSCQCGGVLTGTVKPWQCPLFGGACTPESPVGALMVSSEGACAAYHQYGGLRKGAA
ncbi:hydrogenase formation protein HypD [Azospirillum thermophilum]|uniref:Hydrogenase maturation factor n=1 Tax=Azospirillum thermophilum TaxID=2202148 RepID=A0A2S2CZB6_9PROT|nr:hydrogenase formation protein HypD [Azospirillum thermophilum]AWK89720.1 hydrogenase formation protein HypD [Azospirillum thermophilum]